MDTGIIMGIFGAVVGTAFVFLGFARKGLPPRKRWMFVYAGICFYVFGALEWFGIIHLASM